MSALSCAEFQSLIPHFEGKPLTTEPRDGVAYEDWTAHFHACEACSDKVLEHRLRGRGVDPAEYPCVHMAYRATETCEQHTERDACNHLFIAHSEVFDEYSIIKSGGAVTIDYCPWCGVKLPASQRDRWFDELEAALGKHPFDVAREDWPAAYRTSAWRKVKSGGGEQ